MVRPVSAEHRVTLGYRQRANFDPNYIHRGVDYGCPEGTPVVATTDGIVVYAGDARPRGGGYGPAFGIHVVVRTGNIWHLYGHLSEARVSFGQQVKAGQQVGESGATGNVTGEHLHYAEFTEGPAAYKSDRSPRFIDAASSERQATVFDVSFWNVASPRWYTAWRPRADGIGAQIRGEASVYGFAEVYTEAQAGDLQDALGAYFVRVPGRAGLEFFYDLQKWSLQRTVYKGGYFSRIQGRYALVVHLTRKETGQHVAFVLTHGPVQSDSLKRAFGKWHAALVGDVEGPVVALGDYNRNTDSPRKELEALGYRDMREQAAIANESADEFPSEGWNLSDIYTIPARARITGGEIDLTSSTLSDHRRIEARVVIP